MSTGKKNRMLAQYQYEGRLDDFAALDELAADCEAAEELDGMRMYDPDWSDGFIDEIAERYGEAVAEAIAEGRTEAEAEKVAIEEVAAQTGYTSEEIRFILEEGSARLQDSMQE